MKLNLTAKKTISAFLIFLLMAGLYGAIFALCNYYLQVRDMQTKTVKFALGMPLFVGYYFIYKWFARRLDRIAKQ